MKWANPFPNISNSYLSELDTLSAFTWAFCSKETLFFVPAFAKAFLQPLVYLVTVFLVMINRHDPVTWW